MDPRRYVICDIEATGLENDKEIIEVALLTIEEDRLIDVYQTLVNPLRPVSGFIQDFTSISVRELNEAPKFYDVADALRLRLEGAVFVSHNTDFDYELLKRKFAELGQELNLKTFCTLRIAQEEIPGLRDYSLEGLCAFFGIKLREKHRALSDAEACLALFRELQSLRLKPQHKPLYLPRHERQLKDLSGRAGLLTLRNGRGEILHQEAVFSLSQRARELLEVRPSNRALLEETETIDELVTGSALIAAFHVSPALTPPPKWMIGERLDRQGEKHFQLLPFRGRASRGLWYFRSFAEGKRKLRQLSQDLRREDFAWREGPRSKEEIVRHNQRFEQLAREARLPAENLVIVGEGRKLGERSVVLIRRGQVRGWGHTDKAEEDIYTDPESCLTTFFHRDLYADQMALRHLQVLKNLRRKAEGWRELSAH